MKKPIKPVQEWDELTTETINFYSGTSVSEILKSIGEDVDLDKAIFTVHSGYYDEVEYCIEFPRLVHRKMTDETFAKKMLKYEQALAKYNAQQK